MFNQILGTIVVCEIWEDQLKKYACSCQGWRKRNYQRKWMLWMFQVQKMTDVTVSKLSVVVTSYIQELAHRSTFISIWSSLKRIWFNLVQFREVFKAVAFQTTKKKRNKSLHCVHKPALRYFLCYQENPSFHEDQPRPETKTYIENSFTSAKSSFYLSTVMVNTDCRLFI